MVDLLGIFEVADVVVDEVELHPTNRAGEVVLAGEGVVSVTGEALSLPMSRVSSAEKSDQHDLAPNSVRNVIARLRALLATAVEEGLIRSNPAAGLRLATRRPSNGEQAEELGLHHSINRFTRRHDLTFILSSCTRAVNTKLNSGLSLPRARPVEPLRGER